ncbi:MAG: hypothetical protein FJY07_10240 [Bacteroidetes bacterium]|nr:hypothetical protein [Bacteroidota bacterium]
MKLHQICKYAGFIAGGIGALFIIGGIIGYFIGEFMGVRNFSWFFWAANTFIYFGIFALVGYIACKDKADK